ncbi:hypothetical protein ACFSCX_00750 [Bacillus salitolerans]|uniref:RNA polymerase sigma-70 region 2 domain-containing protein n=1 Tax=Bacillus salitolerans TaxID=1437434 RepID=A0ABW4LIX1_9BACI
MDSKLLKKAHRGDKSAFITLINEHEKMLYRVAFSILRADTDVPMLLILQ